MTEAFKAKVVLVGPPGVGKTSLVRRYVLGEFDGAYRVTLGTVVYKYVAPVDLGDVSVLAAMTLWDNTGAPALAEPARDVSGYGAQGILAVADVTDADTVASLDPWLRATVRIAGDVPVHILLNKADLPPSEDARAAGLEAGFVRGAPVYATSARTGDNVVAAFTDLARRIVGRALATSADDLGLALACSEPRTPEEVARARGVPVAAVEAGLDRLRRRGLVRIVSLALDGAGRPRIAYAATQAAFLEPLLAAQR